MSDEQLINDVPPPPTWEEVAAQIQRIIQAQKDGLNAKQGMGMSACNTQYALQLTYATFQEKFKNYLCLLENHLERKAGGSPIAKEFRSIYSQKSNKEVIANARAAEMLSIMKGNNLTSEKTIVSYIDALSLSNEAKDYAKQFLHEQWPVIVRSSEIFAHMEKQDTLSCIKMNTPRPRYMQQPVVQNMEECDACAMIMTKDFSAILRDQGMSQEDLERTVAVAITGVFAQLEWSDKKFADWRKQQSDKHVRRQQKHAAKLHERQAHPVSQNSPAKIVPAALMKKSNGPEPYTLSESVRHMVDMARNLKGGKKAKAEFLITLVEDIQQQLDARNKHHKTLGDLLLSTHNITMLAYTLDIGKSIQAREPDAVDRRRAKEAKKGLAELYAHEDMQGIIDGFFNKPESALLLAGLTTDLEHCKRCASALMKKETANETGPQRVIRISETRKAVASVKEALLGPNGHSNGHSSKITSDTSPRSAPPL